MSRPARLPHCKAKKPHRRVKDAEESQRKKRCVVFSALLRLCGEVAKRLKPVIVLAVFAVTAVSVVRFWDCGGSRDEAGERTIS